MNQPNQYQLKLIDQSLWSVKQAMRQLLVAMLLHHEQQGSR